MSWYSYLKNFSYCFTFITFVITAYYLRIFLNTYAIADFLQDVDDSKDNLVILLEFNAQHCTLENQIDNQQKSA